MRWWRQTAQSRASSLAGWNGYVAESCMHHLQLTSQEVAKPAHLHRLMDEAVERLSEGLRGRKDLSPEEQACVADAW